MRAVTRREAVEAAAVACGTAGVWAYTAYFWLAATHTICLFAIPPWYYYLPQYIVAVAALLSGIWATLRAKALLRSVDLGARSAAYLAFAVALFIAAGIRLFFVAGSASMCFYPP